MPRSSILLVALCSVLGASCDSVLGPSLDVEITTSRSTYVLQDPGVTVDFTVRNTGTRTVYLQRCGDRVMTFLDRRMTHAWVHHRSDYCPANLLMVPVELKPGEEIRSRRGVHETGRFRLRVGASTSREDPDEWTPSRSSFVVEPGL